MLDDLRAGEWSQSERADQFGLFFGAKRDVQSAHCQLSKAGMTCEV